ncbi:MAG: hypothetical protein COW00_07235 [Bdellovibrio sp. CG12_big_fil_rev_8_21_14_0_65_39_13]|nr:MAG: hypothetical protein COW78_16985 [Bdellovibrio sp. CG22_combo_CG10-13_8_21_14_all_39_27]PIQ60280.1 MAG: hypothetical protein COW00_07235 [Bdellovibrio sp. CG12_big_fil_rev_8_21_14_0_65_39_13]PIR34716.1 MAG: hypothetical protein COV37_12340 [Bdellovibrio sp. CG11_big_fil_rev_8_21_14_0_20_39_38]PJB53312.1 MAG: hypothetical protein CO099_07800 [Bdellovibrio sp. CG_4_9_14_3_um_filter_39_7]
MSVFRQFFFNKCCDTNKIAEMKKENFQWMEEFLAHNERMNRSQHTLVNYRFDLEKFIAWFENIYDLPITKVSAQIISDYQEFLKRGLNIKRPLSHWDKFKYFVQKWERPRPQMLAIKEAHFLAVASQKRHLSTLKNFFEFLKQSYEEKKSFAINPVKDKLHAIKLKDIDQTHTKLFWKQDWDSLNEAITKPQDRLLLQLLYFAGLRLSEATFLRWEHIDFERGRLKIPRKGGKIHEWMPRHWNELSYQLKFHLQKSSTSSFVFCRKNGDPYSTRAMYGRVMKIIQKAGLSTELGPHSFRKGCATDLYLETRDLLYVRDYLNHSDAKVTQTYIDREFLSEQYLLQDQSPYA